MSLALGCVYGVSKVTIFLPIFENRCPVEMGGVSIEVSFLPNFGKGSFVMEETFSLLFSGNLAGSSLISENYVCVWSDGRMVFKIEGNAEGL